jgi:hypothetical protein
MGKKEDSAKAMRKRARVPQGESAQLKTQW